jgi:DUF4097 and DUF4098 domain-containing protein YvlB
MSWFYSIIFAGLMFSSSSDLPKFNNYNYAEQSEKNVLKLDETERFEQTYPLNSNGRVSVSNVNGSITVETWDRNEVKLEYVKTSERKEDLAEVEVRIDAQKDAFSVETDYGDWKRRNSGERRTYNKLQVEYHLFVPRNAVLDEIETVNGSVSIANAFNSTKASAVNGQVRATNLRGATNLSTVNGTLVADFDQLQSGSRISLETVNGTVDLMIPSDANATVKADTVNGQISNDFGLPVRKGEYVGRDLYGKIGSGDVQIRLNSVNGALSVKRKNDGKKVNPATNLLTQKSKADDDMDKDDDEDVDRDADENDDNAKNSRAANERKARVDQREINRAMIDAQKELTKIKPKLDKINAEALKQAQVNIDSEKLNAQIAQAQRESRETLVRVAEANWIIGSPKIESKSESFAVKGTPKVTLDVKNCAVTVRGWDKQEVQYSATRFSKLRNQAPLNLNVTQDGSDLTIKSINDNASAPNGGFNNELNRFHIEVFVPQKSNLKIITTGEIRLEGVSGTIDLRGADDAINVRDGDGLLTVSGNDARIRIIGFRGEVESRTLDGSMFLEGGFKRLLAETSNGTIVLDLPENVGANLMSNTDINFEGINPSKKGDKNWRVGNGSATYTLHSADGEVFVRPANVVKSN